MELEIYSLIIGGITSFIIGVTSSFFASSIKPMISIIYRFQDIRGTWVGRSMVEGCEHQEVLILETQILHKFWGKFESPDRIDKDGNKIIYPFKGHFFDDQHGMIEFKPSVRNADSFGVSYFKLDRFNNAIIGASVTSSKETEKPIVVNFEYHEKANNTP